MIPVFEKEVESLAEFVRRFTVFVSGTRGTGHGSGVVWHSDGLIATNAHVATTGRFSVGLADGRELQADLVARDPRRDIALLRVKSHALPTAPLGDPGQLRAGSLVFAIGHPWGVPHALSLGVVHSLFRAPDGTPRWIGADIRLAPGNSGGPLVDAGGRVVGINAMIVNGLGAAIPVNRVHALVREAGERGALDFARAWAA